MKNISLGLLLTAVIAGPAAAQDSARNEQVAVAMENFTGGRYVPPECDALDNTGHFKVSSGRTYLSTAITKGEIRENRERQLSDAKRVITEAITQNGRGESPSAWYFLGRVYLHQGDLAGADSALGKAEALAPDCRAEIDELRRVAFVALINPGIDSMKAERNDAALRLFREAAQIYPAAPDPVYYQATLLYNTGKIDSAIPLFKQAIERASTDTTKQQIQNQARFYYGYSLLQQNRAAEAVPVLETYVQANPDDVDGKKLLVNAYRATGQADKAAPYEQELVSSAGEGGAAVTGGDLFSIGVARFQEKKYAEAADAFGKVVAAEPYNRDALFNLANTYLALEDSPKLIETATKLTAIDPMNERALQLLGEGYRMGKKQDLLIKTVERITPMLITIENTAMQTNAQGATLTATATGREAMTLQGKPVPPAPVALSVEFLDAQGNVVSAQEVSIPALKAGETHTITVQGTGAGIAAWRYHKK